MRVVVLTTDSREHFRDYRNDQPYFGAAPEALLQGFSTLPDVEVHVVSCVRRPVRSPEKIAANIWYHALVVPKIGWMTSGYLGCIRAVRRKLAELHPEIVHGQGTERECAITAVFSGFPNVLTIHGNMAELARHFDARLWSYHWVAARFEDFTLRSTSGVFCNSAYTESLVAPRARRTWRVPNALRAAFFAKPAGEPRAGRPVLLNIGVVTPRKRQVELLDTAAAWHAAGLSFELHFIGACNVDCPDAYQRDFLARIREAEARGYARYAGTLATDGLVEALDRAHAVIHFPSEEAFGLVVAEALARGLKFFGARVGGIPDIAEGMSGAELVEAGDWPGLRDAVGAWLRAGAPLPRSVGAEVEARFHPQVIALRHLEIYRETISPV